MSMITRLTVRRRVFAASFGVRMRDLYSLRGSIQGESFRNSIYDKPNYHLTPSRFRESSWSTSCLRRSLGSLSGVLCQNPYIENAQNHSYMPETGTTPEISARLGSISIDLGSFRWEDAFRGFSQSLQVSCTSTRRTLPELRNLPNLIPKGGRLLATGGVSS